MTDLLAALTDRPPAVRVVGGETELIGALMRLDARVSELEKATKLVVQKQQMLDRRLGSLDAVLGRAKAERLRRAIRKGDPLREGDT
jgi:hypothetical protein